MGIIVWQAVASYRPVQLSEISRVEIRGIAARPGNWWRGRKRKKNKTGKAEQMKKKARRKWKAVLLSSIAVQPGLLPTLSIWEKSLAGVNPKLSAERQRKNKAQTYQLIHWAAAYCFKEGMQEKVYFISEKFEYIFKDSQRGCMSKQMWIGCYFCRCILSQQDQNTMHCGMSKVQEAWKNVTVFLCKNKYYFLIDAQT